MPPMQLIDRPIPGDALQRLLAARIPPALARLYAARGVTQLEQLDYRLQQLPDFTRMKGAAAAGQLLADCLQQGKRILIIADYDADGATACAVAVRGLRMLGGIVDFLVPNRFEYGYGLTPEIVELAAERLPDLLVTVDNGIASLDGVAAAQARGLPVLITDHHLPGPQLPEAAAIVNPNQPGCDFPSKAMAGVGVMFYVLLATRAALRERGHFTPENQPNLATLLDLVALGTVADVVPLDALNRCLVYQGLRRMRAGQACSGIRALAEAAGRSLDFAGHYELGFVLGPRLNAAGRLEDMTIGIQCLLSDDPAQTRRWASELEQLNQARKDIEADMQEVALNRVDLEQLGQQHSIVLYDRDWHQGVVGLLAGRLKERFHRPTLVFARGQDGLLKGSGRSIAGFHLRDALDWVSKQHPDLLHKFGGHAAAAGLTLAEADFPRFAACFEDVAQQWLQPAQLQRQLETDGTLPPHELTLPLAEALESQVWGQGFAEPVYRGYFRVSSQRVVGERHLKLQLTSADGQAFDAILFNQVDFLPDRISIAYRISINRYAGRSRLQLVVQQWQSAESMPQ